AASTVQSSASRGVWKSRTWRGGVNGAGRGTGFDRHNWGALVRGGAVSAERNAYAPVSSRKSRVESRRGRRVLLKSYRSRSSGESQVIGAASSDEPGAPVAAAGQEGRSPADARGDLRLVHRRL